MAVVRERLIRRIRLKLMRAVTVADSYRHLSLTLWRYVDILALGPII